MDGTEIVCNQFSKLDCHKQVTFSNMEATRDASTEVSGISFLSE